MFSTHILGGAKFCDADASRLVTAANRAIAPAAGRVGARRGSGPWRRRFAVARRSPLPCAGRGAGTCPPPRAAPRLVDRGASSRRRRSSASDAPSSTRPLRLHPPPSPPLLPRVEHVILPADARAAGPACEVLARLVPGSPRVDETTIRELVALGAVWHAPRPPPPAPAQGPPWRAQTPPRPRPGPPPRPGRLLPRPRPPQALPRGDRDGVAILRPRPRRGVRRRRQTRRRELRRHRR